ncbi:P-loop NTPase family protein [Paenibacillus albus]|uniref:Thymidylate kinase n=1 Tax=Paenibacillus albus TaxID=2495582 RepID=A0A3S9ABZ9_9BACL|nr:DNA/RNA helicase domain-containing protein [Paenibacillus albus]AZN43248.1 hypothetical protein EJC50_28835 [Paenibacillus albus]
MKQQKEKQLIIIDGIPGSGKTTMATHISGKLTDLGVSNRLFVELEENHPLMLKDVKYESLSTDEGADTFIAELEACYAAFVQDRLNQEEQITIIESVMLQDVISVSHLCGMDRGKLHQLAISLQRLLEPLNPALIYYYHFDVEGQWRFICGVRGNEWGPVSLHTDEDFKEAGEVWSRAQVFVRAAVDEWTIPKLIIENRDYLWDQNTERAEQFLAELLGSGNSACV